MFPVTIYPVEHMSGTSSQTPQVLRAPKLFWQTRRLDGHRNWPFAFWRELIQNSADAGAREIEIKLERAARSGAFGRLPEAGEVIRVVFADDGHGMTEDIIRNVFLEPGRSTKTAGASIGGFGTARTLLCFSQDRYEIHTNGLVVEGDGSEYILERAEEAAARATDAGFLGRIRRYATRRGCVFVVDVDPAETEYSWRNVSEARLRQELFEVLNLSQLGFRSVRVDGVDVVAGLRKGAARTRLSAPGFEEFASVHTSQTGNARYKGRVIIRVNGLVMFQERIPAEDTQIILELDPDRTRALLTDNRDELKDGPDQALRAFIRDLEVNRREALRDRSGDKEWTLAGELGAALAYPEPLELVGVPALSQGVPDGAQAPVAPVPERASAPGASGNPATTAVRAEDAIPGLHDFHIHAEGIKGNPVLETAARRWQPKYWRKQGESLAGRGRESHELLAAWTAACSHALGVIGTLRPVLLSGRGHIPFVPGFVIAPSRTDVDGATHRLGGMHKLLPGDRHALLVNPILDDGSAAYNLRQLRDGDGKFGLQRLVHVAVHEACHVMGRSHDERFANLLTTVSASLDYGKLAASMRDKINAVRALYGAKEARFQAIEQLGEFGVALDAPGQSEPAPKPTRRMPRPAGRAMAIAYPTAAGVMGAVAAPENAALPADGLRAALDVAIEPRSETETTVHLEILERIDTELAQAARQNWEPPKAEQADPGTGSTPTESAPEAPQPAGEGGLDALAIDFGALPEFDGLNEAAAPPRDPVPASPVESPAETDEKTNARKFPGMISIYDIIGRDDAGQDEEGYRP